MISLLKTIFPHKSKLIYKLTHKIHSCFYQKITILYFIIFFLYEDIYFMCEIFYFICGNLNFIHDKKKFVCDKIYFFPDKINFIPDKKVVKMFLRVLLKLRFRHFVDTNRPFLNFIKLNQIRIVITIFRLIWLQTELCLGPNQSENCIYNQNLV